MSDPNTFKKVRKIRNTILHSITMEVSDADMNEYLKDMETVLSEKVLMTENNKDHVTKAINRLKQLPKDAMCTNCIQTIESRTDALHALSLKKQHLQEIVKEERQQELAKVLRLENKHNKAIVKTQTKYNSTIERYEAKITEIRHNRMSIQDDLTKKKIDVEPELQDALDFKVEILHTDRTGMKYDVPMVSGSSLDEDFVVQMKLKNPFQNPSFPLETRDKVDVVRAIEHFGWEIDGSPPLIASRFVRDSIKSVMQDKTGSLSWAEKQGKKMMYVLETPASEAEKLLISRGICGILSEVLKKQTKENSIMMVDFCKDSKLLTLDDQVKNQVDLAMAVALVYVDTNDNLDLVNDSSLWKRALWVHMLRMPLQWKYVTCVIDGQKQASTGFEGHDFKVKLPFSWVIKNTVDKITKNIKSHFKTNATNNVERCSRELRISKAVKQLENIHEQADVFDSYLHDILHMKYNPATERELKFVLRVVKALMVKQFGKEKKNILSQIILLHATLDTTYWQLRLFRRVTSVWPECCETIEGLEEQIINQVIGDNNLFIFPVIKLLIDQLSPKGHPFIQAADSANEWLQKVEEYRPIVEKTFDFQNDRAKTGFAQKARKQWNRVLVVKLFAGKVCRSDSEYALCKHLWEEIGTDADLKEKEPMDRIGKVLRMCPQEQRSFNRCNTFLMAVITQFCFAGGTSPSGAVITDFLNYISGGTSSTMFTTETFDAQQLILRLLIATDERRVKEHLKTRRVKEHLKTRDVAKMYLPIIEDKFEQMRILKGENKMMFAKRELQQALAIVTTEDLSDDMLYCIAHARAGLCAVADCMAGFAKEHAEIPGQDLQELCDHAKTLCQTDKSNWCHVFLVKLICLKYDVDVYFTLCDIPSLKWMLMQELHPMKKIKKFQWSHFLKTISKGQHAFADKPDSLIYNAATWRLHEHVSLAHAEQSFNSIKQRERKVIEVFLKENKFLQAMRFLPKILRLQARLSQLLQGDSFAEMGFETVHELIQKQGAGPETEGLVNDFRVVWDIFRKHLQHHQVGIYVPSELCSRSVDMESPVSMLLPALTGPGVCSYALLESMFKKQNYILHECCYKTDGRNSSEIPVVPPVDVTSADLICYDQDNDILSLFQTHAHTQFENDDYYDVEYDFEAIERDIIDRFLSSKSFISTAKITELLHCKKKSSKDGNIIDLAGKIPQALLCVSDKIQICNKQQLSEVKALIDDIKTVAKTLAVVGGDPEDSLYAIMIEALPMTTSYTDRVTQMCKLKHVQSLWILLELQKSKMMIADPFSESQDIFVSLTAQYHERLTHDLVMKLTTYADGLPKEHMSLLIEILHEFIMLVLTNSSDLYVRLHERLRSHVTDKYLSSEKCLEIFEHFPTEVLYKHCADAWITTYKALKRKIGRRA